jgi:DnaK suppressor protein
MDDHEVVTCDSRGKNQIMDAKLLAKYRRLLLEEKQRIMNNSKNALKHELTLSPDDLPDETDLAASEVNQNLVFKLRDRERQLLSKIDEALGRMDEGQFGICQDCEEPIEPRRLEARPVSTLCIACKEKQEHREKIYA